jgi:uncharacterized protein YfiM (DUF2279 family)
VDLVPRADRIKHFMVGTFTQGMGYGVARTFGAARGTSLVAASTVTVGVAYMKERMDERERRGAASVADFAWTLAGGAGVSVALGKAR